MYIQLAARPITCILAPLNTLWFLLCLEMKEMCEFDIIRIMNLIVDRMEQVLMNQILINIIKIIVCCTTLG